MKATDRTDLTRLLQRWRGGDAQAASQLLGVVYRDLRRIAGKYMRGERPRIRSRRRRSSTKPGSVCRKAPTRQSPRANSSSARWPRTCGAISSITPVGDTLQRGDRSGRCRFGRISCHAGLARPGCRRRPRGGSRPLDAALAELASAHPRAANVLQFRFFANKSVEETAADLRIATGTVKRDFAFARSFIIARMRRKPTPPPRA